MNRKIMWIMIAAVAALLPAVAVADVLIDGNFGASAAPANDAFSVQEGPNYANAHSLTGLTWTSHTNSESEVLGNLSIGYMSNETITEINVLDINFTGSGTFYFNVTIPNSQGVVFSTGSMMYVSSVPETFGMPGLNVISLVNSGTTSLSFSVTYSTTLYIGFMVGPDSMGGSFLVGMHLVAL